MKDNKEILILNLHFLVKSFDNFLNQDYDSRYLDNIFSKKLQIDSLITSKNIKKKYQKHYLKKLDECTIKEKTSKIYIIYDNLKKSKKNWNLKKNKNYLLSLIFPDQKINNKIHYLKNILIIKSRIKFALIIYHEKPLIVLTMLKISFYIYNKIIVITSIYYVNNNNNQNIIFKISNLITEIFLNLFIREKIKITTIRQYYYKNMPILSDNRYVYTLKEWALEKVTRYNIHEIFSKVPYNSSSRNDFFEFIGNYLLQHNSNIISLYWYVTIPSEDNQEPYILNFCKFNKLIHKNIDYEKRILNGIYIAKTFCTEKYYELVYEAIMKLQIQCTENMQLKIPIYHIKTIVSLEVEPHKEREIKRKKTLGIILTDDLPDFDFVT